jgi:type VI secretion system protein ImpF
MAPRNLGESTITLSLLDRLIDRDPQNQVEAVLSRAQSVRQLKAGVRRDLEWLLNTRSIADAPDESLESLNKSAYVYGLPDMSTLTMANPADRTKLLSQIKRTINFFEKRLANVQVSIVQMADAAKKDVHLRIDAMLRMDPVPEPVFFDTVIELKSGVCRLSGGDDA